MKKALIVCHVAGFLNFLVSDIQIMLDLGYSVDIATNFSNTKSLKPEAQQLVKNRTKMIDIPFPRSPFSSACLKSYKMLKKFIVAGKYDLIHCHTPVGGVLTRLAARKSNAVIIYTAHGFHFFKGASFKNWLLYYPVEKLCSRWTDILITINTEDFEFAKKKMKAKKVIYVPGVGIDLTRFNSVKPFDIQKKRDELGIKIGTVLLFSLGELNENNYLVILEALHLLKNNNKLGNVIYCICGQENEEDELKDKIASWNLGTNVKLLGDRKDINEICQCSDIFVFSSSKEKLPIALLEAMASGLPCIVSSVRENIDLIENGKGGYLCDPKNPIKLADSIEELIKNKTKRKEMGAFNLERIKHYNFFNTERSEKQVNIMDMNLSFGDIKSLNKMIARNELRTRLGVSPDDKMFLSVGELNRNKNHIIVLKALANLKRKGVQTKYVICGLGPMKEKLEQVANKLGYYEDLKLVGYQQEIEQYYHAADFFIFPSLREGLSVSLMEAMACGLPCLVSDIRGNRDLIIDKNYYFNPKDEKELILKINKQIDNQTSLQLSQAYYKTIETFSKDIVKNKMKELYKECYFLKS